MRAVGAAVGEKTSAEEKAEEEERRGMHGSGAHLEAVVGRQHREGRLQVGVIDDVLRHLRSGSGQRRRRGAVSQNAFEVAKSIFASSSPTKRNDREVGPTWLRTKRLGAGFGFSAGSTAVSAMAEGRGWGGAQ